MTTFNFTVRATDDRGAFADRDFSIKVRNTIIDRYMAMSSAGLYTSPDATTWTLRPGIGNSASVNAQTEIVNGNGRWLMNKDGTNYLMSLDGVNWTPYPLPGGGVVSMSVVGAIPRFGYGNGKFVCSLVNQQGTNAIYLYKIWTSADGITWTNPVTTVTSGYAQSLAYAGNIPSYNAFTPPPVYGNGRWTVVNPLGGFSTPSQLLTSTDGMATFTTLSQPLTSVATLMYVNGLWITTSGTATGTSQTPGVGGASLATSVDGVTWSSQVMPAGYQNNDWAIRKVLYGNGRIVAVPSRIAYGTSSNPASNVVFVSTDGVSFSVVTLPVSWIGPNTTTNNTHSVTGTFHNGLFILGNSGANTAVQGIITSEDGLTWVRNNGIGATTAIGSMGSINQD